MGIARRRFSGGNRNIIWTISKSVQGIQCKADWYYVMNMLHSDFVEVLGNDTSNYVRMAKAYMCDPDAAESKVFDLWTAGMRAKREE